MNDNVYMLAWICLLIDCSLSTFLEDLLLG